MASPGRAPSGPAFALRSNSGNQWIQAEVSASTPAGVTARLSLRGECWGMFGNPEVSLQARDVPFDRGRLQETADELKRWAELPPHEQAARPLRGRYLLVSDGDRRLELRFGPREDLSAAGANPAVTAIYAFGRLRGEFSFLTDLECLRAFVAEIGALPPG